MTCFTKRIKQKERVGGNQIVWGCSGGCWTPKRSAVTVGGGQAEGRLVRYFGLRFCGVFEAPRPREDPGRRPRSLRSPSTPPTPLPGPSQGRQEAGPELPAASQRPPCSHPTAEAAQSTLGLPTTPDPPPPQNPHRGAGRTAPSRRGAERPRPPQPGSGAGPGRASGEGGGGKGGRVAAAGPEVSGSL